MNFIKALIGIIPKTVRPFMGYALTIGVLYLTFTGQLSEQFIAGIYGTVLGFYFGERAALKQPNEKSNTP